MADHVEVRLSIHSLVTNVDVLDVAVPSGDPHRGKPSCQRFGLLAKNGVVGSFRFDFVRMIVHLETLAQPSFL